MNLQAQSLHDISPSHESPIAPPSVDIALIVALDEEYQSIKRTLALSAYNTAEKFHWFKVETHQPGTRPIHLVIHVMGEMGLVAAANATNRLLDKCSPSWLISVGLSGQLTECALGDVVVARACDLVHYQARLSVEGMAFAGKTHEVFGLREFVASVDLPKFLQGRELIVPLAAREKLEAKGLLRKFPRVHSGVVCSTDFVVDSAESKKQLLQRNRKLLCTDMESAAVVNVAVERGYSGHVAVIRAISDPADGTKKDIDALARAGTIRQYAMCNAAALLQFAVLQPMLMGDGENRYVDRPLVREALLRLQQVGAQLAASSEHQQIVAEIDKDERWLQRDSEIAKYVYRAKVSQQGKDVARPIQNAVTELHDSPVVNFYVALHIIRSLAADFAFVPELLTPLTHVHTYQVNQFCKALLNSAAQQGKLSRLIDRIKSAYDIAHTLRLESAAKSNLHAHLCYLLGRVSGEQFRRQAAETLEAWRERLTGSIAEKKRTSAGRRQLGVTAVALERFTKEQLLQYRTIQISLVQLGGQDESDRYILSCITSARLDAQNRGFHLEYYGDTPYDPAQPLSNSDGLGAIPRTLLVLGDKLLQAFADGRKYPLRDIDLYTVIALLRSRLQHGSLLETDRERGSTILSAASWMSGNQKLRMLLDRVASDLLNQKFHPAGVVEEIYRLKKLKRAGWSARGRTVREPESVASHTFGGLVLIELFLPETGSPEARAFGKSYKKETVLRLFVKHDWAEAIIGDLLPDEKTEEAGAREDAAFRMLGLVSIYSPYTNRTIYEDWLAFERGTAINSQLARDVDQLDCLQQILIESQESRSAIPDREAWLESIWHKLWTDWGKQMFRFLVRKD